MPKFINRMQILARCDRQAAFAGNARHARIVVGDGRLFQPIDIILAEFAGGADSLLDRPAHISIDHQRHIRPNALADRLHSFHIFRELTAADFYFDGAESFCEIAARLLDQFGRAKLEVNAAGIGARPAGMPRPAAARAVCLPDVP